MKTMRMKIADLKPHPKNEEIYGYNEDVSDLVEKIKRSKSVHTLVINSDNYILAGHRRRRACMELGIKEVDVEVRDFNSPEEELEFIIDNNATREKTAEQKSREAKALKEVESVLALKRKEVAGKNYGIGMQKHVPNSAQPIAKDDKGKSRDVVAKKVGFKSGHEVDRGIKAINKIDELTQQGRIEDAELIRGVLNNGSVSGAEELARNIDIVKIPEREKELVKTGKKSAYSYVEEAKQKNKIKSETKTCNDCGRELPIEYFYKGKNICKDCCAKKDRERRSGIFRDSMGNEIKYDKSLINSKEMLDAINDVKYGGNSKKGIDYHMEVEFFKVNLDNYLFQNQKFIEGKILDNMPLENLNELKIEVERLSNFVKLLKTYCN